jgi:DNA-binding MarR family transcriptional regulator
MKSKKELIEELNQSMQRSGTLTIGLSATEFESMDLISRHQPMSAGDLAFKCGLTTGAITGIVDRLERVGLVRRLPDPRDRRRVLLKSIEDQAKSRRICSLYEHMSQAFEEVMAKRTPEEIQFLIEIHNEMNDAVEKIITDLRRR